MKAAWFSQLDSVQVKRKEIKSQPPVGLLCTFGQAKGAAQRCSSCLCRLRLPSARHGSAPAPSPGEGVWVCALCLPLS